MSFEFLETKTSVNYTKIRIQLRRHKEYSTITKTISNSYLRELISGLINIAKVWVPSWSVLQKQQVKEVQCCTFSMQIYYIYYI